MNPHATSRSSSISLRRLGFVFSLALFGLIASVAPLHAGSYIYWNGDTSSIWNTADGNWNAPPSGGVPDILWNNANGDTAAFDGNFPGAVIVNAPINVTAIDFANGANPLSGSSALTFGNATSTNSIGTVNGSGVPTTGNIIDVNSGAANAVINAPINSSFGLQKWGAGTLTLGGQLNFSGTGFNLGAPNFFGDLVVGGDSSVTGSFGGTLAIANSSNIVPATTRLGIGNGIFDIRNNNVTLSQLTFENVANNTVANGVTSTGGGTLTVTGEINVLGNPSGSTVNSIFANLNIGSGTQIIRTESGSGASFSTLQIAGVISGSGGSLLKSLGYAGGGSFLTIPQNADGLALYGNNTYTGSTTMNGGPNIITGTNLTSSVKVAGSNNASTLTLQGANGSVLSATTIEAQTGGTFAIDNNATAGGAGGVAAIAGGNNSDRINNSAEIQLLSGTFTYKGVNGGASTETFGNLNVIDGANTVTITPGTGAASVALTASGNLLMGSRATLAITTPNVLPTPAPPATPVSTLGGTAQLFVTGSAPATDATGLVDRVYSGSAAGTPTDFVKYSPATGFTPLAVGDYSSTFTTGTNVFTSGNATVATSVSVNAIKEAPLTAFGSATTTINAGQTLSVTSGMLLSALGGTRTYAGNTASATGGSTLDFGSAAGVSFGNNNLGTVANPIAITGSAGIINSVGTLNIVAGDDLSGLTGDLTNNGTTTLNTNTFGGTIHILNGAVNINTIQTLGAGGAITIGIPQNDSNLVGLAPNLNLSGMAANSSISRDIIFNNGGLTAAGAAVKSTFNPSITVLGNTTANGNQTFSGNITVDSPGVISGGSPSLSTGLGSTNFTGNVSGPSTLQISSDRANFSGNISNAGGVIIGATTGSANGTQVTFSGTATGSVPISLESGNTGATAVGTQLRYNAGSLSTGPITVENLTGGTGAAIIVPLQNSTINNSIVLNSSLIGNVGSGISASWNGPISGSITNSIFGASGNSTLTKIGLGTLTLGGANTYAGSTTVSNGTLVLNYAANNTSYLSDTAALVLGGGINTSGFGTGGGGTLNLFGGSHTEVVGSTTLNNGSTSVISTSGSSTLQMNAITRNAGSTVNFGGDNIASTDTSNLGGNGILGGYATVAATTGSADWAKSVNSGAADTAVTAFTTYDAFATSGTDNNNPLLTGSSALTGNLTTNSLKINSSGVGQSLDVVNGQTLTVNSGGLLYVGANDYQINNGTIKSGTATASDLIVQQWGAGTLTVNSVIANGTGVSTLTKAGSGTLALTNQNTYTGTTFVDGGTLLANNATSSTGSGAVNVNAGGTLAGTGKVVGAVTVNTGGTVAGSNTFTLGSTLTVFSGGTVAGNGITVGGATTVNSGGLLGGLGTLAAVTNAGGTIAPGNGIGATGNVGTLNTGNLTLAGNFLADINLNNGGAASADLLNVTGSVNITGTTLNLSLGNVPLSATSPETFIIVKNDAADAVTGTFTGVLGNFQSATVIYNYTGTDFLGQVGDGNDIAVTFQAVPEPATFVMPAFGALALLLHWRRRAARKSQELQARA